VLATCRSSVSAIRLHLPALGCSFRHALASVLAGLVLLSAVSCKPRPTTPTIITPSRPALLQDGETLSIDFPDEEVRAILKQISETFGIRMVIPPTLQGSCSIKVRNVTWRQLLKEVLIPINYVFYLDSTGTVHVVSLEEFARIPMQRYTIRIPDIQPVYLAYYIELRSLKITDLIINYDGVSFYAKPTPLGYSREHFSADFIDAAIHMVTSLKPPRRALFRYPLHWPERLPPFAPYPLVLTGPGGAALAYARSQAVLRFDNVNAQLAEPVLASVLHQGGQLRLDAPGNRLIATGTVEELARLAALTRYLDDLRWYAPPPSGDE
jgi:type II secretory pathway component GspD/PulD (secretin)